MSEREQSGATDRARDLGAASREHEGPGTRRYPRVRSRALFGESSCVVIEHGQEEYRLQITRLGKLILTK